MDLRIEDFQDFLFLLYQLFEAYVKSLKFVKLIIRLKITKTRLKAFASKTFVSL